MGSYPKKILKSSKEIKMISTNMKFKLNVNGVTEETANNTMLTVSPFMRL